METLALLSVGLNVIFGVISFLVKSSLEEKERRISALENDNDKHLDAIRKLEVAVAAHSSNIQGIDKMFASIHTQIERILDKLDKEKCK